jgi:hypothetical protein
MHTKAGVSGSEPNGIACAVRSNREIGRGDSTISTPSVVVVVGSPPVPVGPGSSVGRPEARKEARTGSWSDRAARRSARERCSILAVVQGRTGVGEVEEEEEEEEEDEEGEGEDAADGETTTTRRVCDDDDDVYIGHGARIIGICKTLE